MQNKHHHTTPRNYFSQLRQQGVLVTAKRGWGVRHLSLANHHIVLRFAGNALADQLLPALGHLTVDPADESKLTIDIWDSASTKVAMLPPPWTTAAYGRRREIQSWSDDDNELFASFDVGSGVLSLFNSRENHAIWWVRSAENLPRYEQAAPFRTILQRWLMQQNAQVVHAAAVGCPGMGAALLVGSGGAGKSTTALACLTAGMQFAGEDYCVVNDPAGHPSVSCIYSTAKLDDRSLAWLPQLAPLAVNPQREPDEKAILHLHPQYTQELKQTSMPLRAILIPQIINAVDTSWEKATAAAALKALAPSTILQLSGANGSVLRTLAQLVQRLPCFHLNIGRDIGQSPLAIQQILRRVQS